MFQSVGILSLLVVCVNCIEVKLSKRSTVYFPYMYNSSGVPFYSLEKVSLEQTSYDHVNKIMYGVGSTLLHVIDVSDPDNMRIIYHLDYPGMEFTDVEFCGGHVFTAIDNKTDRANGKAIIFSAYNATTMSMTELMQIPVGSVPDMVSLTSDCSKLVVAVEAEAYLTPSNQIMDPPGLIVIITFPNGVNSNYNVVSLNFNMFNDRVDELSKSGVRHVYRENNNTFSNDVEPEYISINYDNTIAYVGLQENNAVAVVDLVKQNITGIYGLGFKNWSQSTLDPSDKDNGEPTLPLDAVEPASNAMVKAPTTAKGVKDILVGCGAGTLWGLMFPYSVMGMYLPDAIKHFTFKGDNYIIMANEGDAKVYETSDGTTIWSEESRASKLESTMLPSDLDATTQDQVKRNNLLGRLKVSVSPAEMDASGRLKALYAYGGRSFSIRRADDMSLVYDSGNDLASKIFQHRHELFNSHLGDVDDRPFENFDVRSDDKGVETEALTIGVVDGVTLLFVANERPGTILVYSLDSDIRKPVFQDIYDSIPDTRSKTWAELYNEKQLSEVDPEDLHFIPASKSPTGKPILFVCGSVTGTLSIIDISITSTPDPFPVPCTSSVMRIGANYLISSLLVAVTSLCRYVYF